MKNFTKGWLALNLFALIGCEASTPPAVGVWGVEMNTPLGNIPATLTINEDGSGSMGADQLGEAPISGITFDGNSVAFETSIDAQGQSLTLQFNGSIDGDSLNGEFGSDFGSFGVTGSRQ